MRIFLTILFAVLIAFPVTAQQSGNKSGANHVTWDPSFNTVCQSCPLAGLKIPFWNIDGAYYAGSDFTNANLEGVAAHQTNFAGVNAPGVRFDSATLTGAQFQEAILSGANLHKSVANGADFTDANLQVANLVSAKLIGAILHNVDATGVFGTGADFSGANLTGVHFDAAHLNEAVFDSAVLANARFPGAQISGATFRDARLVGADLSRAIGYETAIFEGACISNETRLPYGVSLPICADLVVSRPISLIDTINAEQDN